MIRAAAALLSLAGTAAAEEASRDFVTLSYGEAVFGLAPADVMTAARQDGPVLMILFEDRVHNAYVLFTNDHIGEDGILRICGETVGTLRLTVSAYFASLSVNGLPEEDIAHWVKVLKSGTCAAAVTS